MAVRVFPLASAASAVSTSEENKSLIAEKFPEIKEVCAMDDVAHARIPTMAPSIDFMFPLNKLRDYQSAYMRKLIRKEGILALGPLNVPRFPL